MWVGHSCCGGDNHGGILASDAGPPLIDFAGTIPYTLVGNGWGKFGFETNNRWQFSDDLSWVKGKHLTITYNEVMNTGINPTIAFSPSVASTLAFTSGVGPAAARSTPPATPSPTRRCGSQCRRLGQWS